MKTERVICETRIGMRRQPHILVRQSIAGLRRLAGIFGSVTLSKRVAVESGAILDFPSQKETAP